MTARIYQFPRRGRDLVAEGGCALPMGLVDDVPPPQDDPPPDAPVTIKNEPPPRGAE